MTQDNALKKVISLLGKSIEYDDHWLMNPIPNPSP